MKTIALFRGINVGGKSTIQMSALSGIFCELGCKNVRTFIQSGNIIFDPPEIGDNALIDQIQQKIKNEFWISPFILILDVEDIEKAIMNNPFPQAVDIPQTLHLGFLSSIPLKPDLPRLEKLKSETEQFRLIGNVFYLFAPDGVGRSKLAAGVEQAMGVPMTDRNWRTVCKIFEIAQMGDLE
jgi:uncharacterized protein (DUF1697 family)